MLDDLTIIDQIIDDVNTLFPKKCPCCGREFLDFTDFINNTDIPEHVYKENFMILQMPKQNIYDILALRNCKCKSTMAIPCAIDQNFKKQLINLLDDKAQKLGISTEEMAGIMRDIVIKRALKRSIKQKVT